MSLRYTDRIAPFALLGLLAVAAGPATAQFAIGGPSESSLMGIKLMASYREVMAKYGAPIKIQAGEPTDPTVEDTGGAGGRMGGSGGRMGGAGGGAFGGGGMRQTGAGSGGTRQFGGGGGGLLGGGSMGGGPGQFGGGRRGLGASGAGAGGGLLGGAPGGLPGFGGGGNAADANLGAAANAGRGGGGQQEEVDPDETTWWYKNAKNNTYYSFLFNHHGKVIQIAEFGRGGGSATQHGIGLGSQLGQIIAKYGFSPNGSPDGDNLVLKYGGEDQVVFQLVSNKVVGISIGRKHEPVAVPVPAQQEE